MDGSPHQLPPISTQQQILVLLLNLYIDFLGNIFRREGQTNISKVLELNDINCENSLNLRRAKPFLGVRGR